MRASSRLAIMMTRPPADCTASNCRRYARVMASMSRAEPGRKWSVPTPQKIRARSAAVAASNDRRINSRATGQCKPMPRCAVSIASAMRKPQSSRWRRNARVASQSRAGGASDSRAERGSATTCAAAKAMRLKRCGGGGAVTGCAFKRRVTNLPLRFGRRMAGMFLVGLARAATTAPPTARRRRESPSRWRSRNRRRPAPRPRARHRPARPTARPAPARPRCARRIRPPPLRSLRCG